MHSATKFIGLDVSKKNIFVAIAEEGREAPRFYGSIAHKPEAVRKLIKQIGGPSTTLEFCYEAGPTGYELYRWIHSMGANCVVIAPSLIPQRPGDQIKTDRRDAIRLAQLFRAGELTPVHVPSREQEAIRELVRARETVKKSLHQARQRLIHFLLRHQVQHPEHLKRRWTKAYRTWLGKLTFPQSGEQLVFDEYLHMIREQEERLERIEAEMKKEADSGPQAAQIRTLQALRGIGLLTAFTITAELGSFDRFVKPQHLMAYLGLVPREYSSGQTVRRGSLTKAGNSHLRRVLIEAAWSYRHRPAVKGDLENRLHAQSAAIQGISWKAQQRLNKRYTNLVHRRGKHKNVAIAAVARELVGFLWAVAQQTKVHTPA